MADQLITVNRVDHIEREQGSGGKIKLIKKAEAAAGAGANLSV